MSAPCTRVQRRPVHGVLLLDKPAGWTSNQALQQAKWLLRAEKAGHTGTLDPLATGLLPLCFGAATKFSQIALDADKVYEADVRLGVSTDTGDADGKIVAECPASVSLAELDAALRGFTGPISQIPPMHSALKKDGRPLYEYARQGIELDREPRLVTIHALQRLGDWVDEARHVVRLRVHCSKGTYIRSLAMDIGQALGCGAHLVALRRTATAGFAIDQCVSLSQLEAMTEPGRAAALLPVQSLLAGHKPITLDGENAARYLSGLRRRGDWPDAPAVAVFGPGARELLGSGHVKAGELIPGRLLSPIEARQILEAHS